jgi:hypothetical protein
MLATGFKKEDTPFQSICQSPLEKEFCSMIPSSTRFDESVMGQLLACDPLVQDYRAFFALFDWSVVAPFEAIAGKRGRPGHPLQTYVKVCLLRIQQGLRYATDVRRFLLQHPLLVIDLGFRLVLDSQQPYGFLVAQTVPCAAWLREHLQHLDRTLLQDLLHATVAALSREIPGLGEVVAFDVKHIYAWVRENNPRVYTPGRYDVTHHAAGDPDCRLGVKKSTNQVQPDGSTKVKKESLFGYGSGVAACTDPVYGDVVVGEYTLPFNEGDVTYFRPLYRHSLLALQAYPTHVTADAAYDSWYVYECAARHGGIGAVPLNTHGHPDVVHDADGTPRCPIGLRMVPTFTYAHPYGYRARRYRCPLLHPTPTGKTCDHEQFKKGKGCQKDGNDELGEVMRVVLDRDGPLYHAIYNQRTSCERINSQAQALGIERPKVRNGRSVANLNTLIYLVINARVLAKAQSINRGLLQMN